MSASNENKPQILQNSGFVTTKLVQYELMEHVKQIIKTAPEIDLLTWEEEINALYKTCTIEELKPTFNNMLATLNTKLYLQYNVISTSTNVDIMLKMGMISYVMQNYKSAYSSFKEAYDMCPTLVSDYSVDDMDSLYNHLRPVQFMLSLTCNAMGETVQSIKHMRDLLEFQEREHPIVPLLCYKIGIFYQAQGELSESRKYISIAEEREAAQNPHQTSMKALIQQTKVEISTMPPSPFHGAGLKEELNIHINDKTATSSEIQDTNYESAIIGSLDWEA